MLRKMTIVSVLVLAAGCGKGEGEDQMTEDTGAMSADMGTTPAEDMSTGSDDGGHTSVDTGTIADAGDGDAGTTEELVESEPNGGTPVEDVDALPIGAVMSGNIGAEDVDVFRIDTEPGKVYVATLTPAGGSALDPHLTVMDDGRDEEAAGNDYVKIMRGHPVEILAMGEEGYYVIVRDSRNVDGGSFGGDSGFEYELTVAEREASENTRGTINFTATLSGTLDGPGAVDLWSFDGSEGTDVVFDFATSGDLAGRLYVYSASTGSWIARSVGDGDPVIDAPLVASGEMLLVVESIAETATGLSYTVDATAN